MTLIKTRIRYNTQIVFINIGIKFVNFLKFRTNCLLKPKKVTRSKMKMYFLNSVIKEIVEVQRIISHPKPVSLKYFSLNFNID